MCGWSRETGENGATWRMRSHLVVNCLARPACLGVLVPPPGAATASHPIQGERLVACL
jgi:hypothetical protein